MCKTPIGSALVPIPYGIHARPADDENYTSTVRFTRQKAMVLRSNTTCCYGDEPGTGKGIKSGTVMDICEPLAHSSNVRAEGSHIIRHLDRCYMNKKNCFGEALFIEDTDTYGGKHDADKNKKPSRENDEGQQNKRTAPYQRPSERLFYETQKGDGKGPLDGFFNQFYDKSGTVQDVDGIFDRIGDYWEDPGLIRDDMQSAWDSRPTWEGIKETTGNIWEGTKYAAGQVYDDPIGAARSTFSYIEEQATSVQKGAKNAYNEHGLLGVAGAAAGVVVDAANPFRKAEVVGDVGKALDNLGDAAKKTKPRNPKGGDSDDGGPENQKNTEDENVRVSEEDDKEKKDCGIGPYRFNKSRCSAKGRKQAHHGIPDFALRTGTRGKPGYTAPHAPSLNDALTICVTKSAHKLLHSKVNSKITNLNKIKNLDIQSKKDTIPFGELKRISFKGIDDISDTELSPKCKRIYKAALTAQFSKLPPDLPVRGVLKPTRLMMKNLSKPWGFPWPPLAK